MYATIAVLMAEESNLTKNGFWLPHDLKEVFWGSLSFFIVVFILFKFGKAPVAKYFAGRTATIEDKLAQAEAARIEAENQRDAIKAALADSDAEAARIVADARTTAAQLAADTDTRAARDAERVRERAAADLIATRGQAESDLSSELSRLSLGAAERVVETSLDDAAQQRLIESYISRVGSQN